MRKKFLCAVSFALFAVLCFCGCQPVQSNIVRNSDPGDTLHSSDSVCVIQIEKSDDVNYSYYLTAPLTEQIVYEKNSIILTGTASNVRYAQVEYEYMEQDLTDNITLFDITVTEVLCGGSARVKKNAILTMGINYNMNNYGEGSVIVEEGKTYLIFCEIPPIDGTDPLERASYMDCWIEYSKNLLIEKVGDYYLTSNFFSEYVLGMSSISKRFGITEDSASKLACMSANSVLDSDVAALIRSSAESANIDVSMDVLSIMKNRTKLGSNEFWILISNSYLIPSSDFENAIRDVIKNR